MGKYSLDFKKEVVLEAQTTPFNRTQICKKYNISHSSLTRWEYLREWEWADSHPKNFIRHIRYLEDKIERLEEKNNYLTNCVDEKLKEQKVDLDAKINELQQELDLCEEVILKLAQKIYILHQQE